MHCQWQKYYMHVGYGKVDSNCFDKSETGAISMATDVTVCVVCMWNGLSAMHCQCHK